MAVHYVLEEKDVPEGGRVIVNVQGREIGVYRIGGLFYALYNYCPHQGAPLCEGIVCGTTMPSDVYAYEYGRAGEIVRCPWHGWEFDIKTGRSLVSGRIRARSYPVELRDGKIGIVMKG
ncbi:2Fe-2S ferredoxin [Paenibacillus sp. 32O-W]|uniref:(2Fe-2S)-binding protein n=1 Tax=Paenibacillus cisolokensis TaxID=1658519 RepID=A0ABQ4NDZ5_9BACL|nr:MULTISPECIES: Rieske (2Fe-2S) protein [Paenibacillus]ALS29046.1 2Fe-2S ferredoxin [Paenibacillus sp. 32O-W]GIQ66429.1 (2Fe-2S)-binding protein [Paenibacillus cisolokensis]